MFSKELGLPHQKRKDATAQCLAAALAAAAAAVERSAGLPAALIAAQSAAQIKAAQLHAQTGTLAAPPTAIVQAATSIQQYITSLLAGALDIDAPVPGVHDLDACKVSTCRDVYTQTAPMMCVFLL